jgi:hypothetical protein
VPLWGFLLLFLFTFSDYFQIAEFHEGKKKRQDIKTCEFYVGCKVLLHLPAENCPKFNFLKEKK